MKATSRGSAALPGSRPVNRRRAVRLDAPPSLCVSFADKQIFATVIDIGVGGIGVLSNTPMEAGATYELTLRLGTHLLYCAAKPAHCQQQDDGQWVVGLAFVKDERFPTIETFIDDLLGSQIEFS